MEVDATACYVITQQTKAIFTKDSAYYKARIFEGTTYQNSIYKPEIILKKNCIVHGSSLIGRRESAQEILNSISKLPVPVMPSKGIYMVPTSSARNPDCVWLSYYQIKFYEQRDHKTFVQFHDGTSIYVNMSAKVFQQQMARTGHVIAQLNRPILFM